MSTLSTGASSRTGLRILLLAFGMLIISIDFNIVYVALPEIGRELGFSTQSLQWVVSAYAVAFGGFLLLGGRLIDRLGPRRMFITAIAIFGVASLVGGFASNAALLVGARAGQGLGAAVLFPATLALINTSFEEGPPRNRAMAAWGTAGASGVIVGAAAGGLLTNFLGWESVFFVNVPMTLGAAILAINILPGEAPRSETRGGFDVPGAILATVGSTLVVFGLIRGPEVGWLSPQGAGALAVGVLTLLVFLAVESRTRDPLVRLSLFGNRGLSTSMVLIFLFMGTVNTIHYIFFIELQNVLDYNALQAGLAFLPMSVFAVFASAKLLPMVLSRSGVRPALIGGMIGTGIAYAVLTAGMTESGSFWLLLPGTILWGTFAGLTFPILFVAATSDVSGNEQGVASALASTAQQIGGAMGLAALVAVANAGLGPEPSSGDVVDGLRTAGYVAAAVTVLGSLVALALRPARRPAAEPSGGSAATDDSAPRTVEVADPAR